MLAVRPRENGRADALFAALCRLLPARPVLSYVYVGGRILGLCCPVSCSSLPSLAMKDASLLTVDY